MVVGAVAEGGAKMCQTFAQKCDWSFIFWAEQRLVNYFAQKCDWFIIFSHCLWDYIL
jgi:hypothetical protein